MTDVAALLEPLAGEISDQAGVLAPVQQQIAQAEAALSAHDARSAIATAQAASERATQTQQALQTYRAIRAGIVQGRKDAEALAADGYRMDASHAALDQARAMLEAAASALQRGELAAGPLDSAQRELARAQANGTGLVQLREENERRVQSMEERGEQVAALIEEGQGSFDLVDDFAESSWSDIRGNGSEAQKAADQAQDLWERAATRNTMETQEFAGARDDLNAATILLDRAETLIEAILKRLKDLQTARDAARDELAAAAADIAAGQQFVQSNDPDVSAEPAERLRRASLLLQEAQAEADKPQPDWLALVKKAQEANAEADAALATARSEVEAIQKLREQIARAQPIARAEVEKIGNFVGIHANDITSGNQQVFNELQQQAQRADAALQQANSVEDEARRASLEEAFNRYTRLQESAQHVYTRMYDDFKRSEGLREQLGQARGRASLALNEAVRLAGSYGAVISASSEPKRLIDRATELLRRIPSRAEGEATIKALIDSANQARSDADQAARLIRNQYSQMSPGPIIGGGLPGSILGDLLDPDDFRRPRRGGGFPDVGRMPDFGDLGGWGSPRGDRSGGDRGGGGSRSGGSWGGGSRSGGSWGGGSRSGGGGWGGGNRSGGGW